MKRILLPTICLLAMVIPSSAQWPVKDESHDREWSIQERARKGQVSESDFTFYPTRSMWMGRGFSGGLAKVTLDGKCGFIDRAGRLGIKPRFDDAGRFAEGLAPVEVNGKWGYINRKGETVIPLKFDWALGFSEGRALIMMNDKWGYVDSGGEIIIEPRFDEAGSFAEGVARVCLYDKDYKWGFIDRVGKYKWGFINKSGGWVLKPVYDSPVYDFQRGRASVGKDIGFKNGVVVDTFYVDKKGRSYPEPEPDERLGEFEDISPFFEGLAYFRLDDKYGYVNKKGSVVVPPRFDLAGIFSEGLAPVAFEKGQGHRGSWGYVNRQGKIVIQPQFDWAWEFSEGRALVAAGERVGYVDRTGHYIWKPSS